MAINYDPRLINQNWCGDAVLQHRCGNEIDLLVTMHPWISVKGSDAIQRPHLTVSWMMFPSCY